MSFDIIPTPFFLKDVKTLSKKYVSLKSDLIKLVEQLLETLDMGEPLGKNCYKIRLPIKSKGKGKSGGGRIVILNYVKYLFDSSIKTQQISPIVEMTKSL